VVASAVAVHGTVKIDAGNTVSVRSEDAFNRFNVGHRCSAFVVDHHVITLCVVGISVDGEWRVGGGIVCVDLSYDGMCPRFDPFFKDTFLTSVCVTATAGD